MNALTLAVRIACVARLISVTEFLTIRSELAPGGLLDWTVASLTNAPTRTEIGFRLRTRFRRALDRSFVPVLALDAGTALALEVHPDWWGLLALVVAIHIVEIKRYEAALDGSDHLMIVLLGAVLLGRLDRHPFGAAAATGFLAVEVSLAYLVAGLYKAVSAYWQDGRALRHVLLTRMFGHARLAPLALRHPELTRAAGIFVFAWESTFPLALVAPRPVLWVYLLLGVGFHLGCAAVMGLNAFLWVFVATYPSVVVANAWVRQHLAAPSLAATLLVLVGMLAAVALLMRTVHAAATPAAELEDRRPAISVMLQP
jgi:hypothetical protein